MTEPTQIRVHGAAGTPASRLLQTDPRAVDDGDHGLGLVARMRRVRLFEATDPVPEGFGALRAYRWSDLTSGTPLQAINALFAPMLLINSAGWMLPRRSGLAGAVSSASMRVGALAASGFSVTGIVWTFYVIPVTGCALLDSSSAAELDAIGIPADLRCPAPLAGGLPEWLGIAAALIVALGLPIWNLRTTSVASGAEQSVPDRFDWPGRIAAVDRDPMAQVLRLTHFAFAAALTLTTVAVSQRSSTWTGIGTAALVVLVTVAAFADPGTGLDDRPSVSARLAAALGIGVIAAITAIVFPSLAADDAVDVFTAHFNLVGLIAAFAVIGLAILGLALIGPSSVFGERGAGFASLTIAALSMMAGGVLAAGLAYVAILILGLGAARDALGGNLALAVAFTATALLVAAGLMTMILRTARSIDAPRSTYGLLKAATTLTRNHLRGVVWMIGGSQAVAWAIAGLADHLRLDGRLDSSPAIPVVFAVLCLWTLVCAVILVRYVSQKVIVQTLIIAVTASGLGAVWWGIARDVEATVNVVALVLPVAFVVSLIYRGVTNATSRRGLALISDLAGFWPRSFHPLVPRPYAAVAVRELCDELERDDAPVVLTGHSQGSMLSVLALHLADQTTVDRVGLLTYGSPVGEFYPALFPASFGDDTLIAEVHARLDGRWTNLHRPTDPIAAPIALLGTDDRCVGDDRTKPRSHSDYEPTEPFAKAARELIV